MEKYNPFTEARNWAENNKFMANDDRLRNTLFVEHYDGIILQRHAFYEEREFGGEKYLILFGEHMRPDVHHMDEVKCYAMFELHYPPSKDEEADEEASEQP